MLRLGFAVERAARTEPPAARSILLITVPNDLAVSNEATQRLVAQWRARGKQSLYTYKFDPALGLPHDLIDPEQPTQQVGVVYPILVELIHGA